MSEEKNIRPLKTALQDSKDDSVSGNSGPVASARAEVNDRTALYLAILAFGISIMAISMHLSYRADQDTILDAKTKAAVAEAEARIRTAVAADAAEAKAVAHAAETHGRLALAGIERAEVELNKQGFKVSLTGH